MLSRIARLANFIGHARARYILIACGLLIGTVVAAGAALFGLELRAKEIAQAGQELQNLSLVLSEEIDRSFQTAELTQRALIDHMRELGIDTAEKFSTRMASQEVHHNLQDRITGLPQIDALLLIDPSGRMLNLSAFWPVPDTDVSDRDYFQALGNNPAMTTFISAPYHTRGNGAWVVFYGRRFIAPDGQFIGIVGTGMRLSFFEDLFTRIAVGDGATFALFRADGVLLARHPHLEPGIGRAYSGPAALQQDAGSMAGGATRRDSAMDGKGRLISQRMVAHFPLIVGATNTVAAVLDGWGRDARWLAGATLLLELVLGGIITLGVRHVHGYEVLATAEAGRALAESELARAQDRELASLALHTQERRFDVALNNMRQGLLMFDHTGRLLVVNRRFHELFGLPADVFSAAASYRDVTELTVTLGNVSADDMEMVRHRRAALVSQNTGAAAVWELSDGRAFTVTHQPMMDGWLATFEDITERRANEARIAHLALHDVLTDLPNRVLFRERLDLALAHAQRGRMLALLCLDLDQFKTVNDTLGHPIGDALLQAVAKRLSSNLRETDLVARLGGDEFAIIQAPIERPTEATGLAQRLQTLLDAPFEVEGHQIVIGTSIGMAFAPLDGLDADQLLKSADLALYRAKVDGRGVYRLFQAEMDAQMQARRLLELDLRLAVRTGQLELFYQPFIDLQAGSVTGFEALLRWRHPEKGIVSPIQFIPLAEEIGLIVPIGEWVLREACATVAAWPGELRIAVNLSPVQFRSRNLVDAIAAALNESGLAPSRLELEITETVMLQDTDITVETLDRIRDLGVCIALDDFGTGYSSLSYLRRFPFNRIKIDQSFVRELGRKRDCTAIVEAVAGLSTQLGMATTAEGVETRGQLEALTSIGCNEVQGYLFSPAVPAADVPALLQSLRVQLDPPTPHGTDAPHEAASVG